MIELRQERRYAPIYRQEHITGVSDRGTLGLNNRKNQGTLALLSRRLNS